MAYKILGNEKTSGNMIWTTVFIEASAVRSEIVIGPASETLTLELAQEEYETLIAIIPGHNLVICPEKISLDIFLTN